ncbi:hypothetical protein AB0M36_05720 [Actinoplanes sp. NPDC051346]|uniref:hypothetical protein n=1 Tax=Actinoplanes sp. NPDC051346 TaxID=3155048 RepID=UPI00342ECBCC
MARIYLADHTAHIRGQFKRSALHCVGGLGMAGLLGVVHLIVFSTIVQSRHAFLEAAAWGAIIILGLLSVLGLAFIGVLYLVYRRRRPDLDAAGAEASGERLARLHRPRPDNRP